MATVDQQIQEFYEDNSYTIDELLALQNIEKLAQTKMGNMVTNTESIPCHSEDIADIEFLQLYSRESWHRLAIYLEFDEWQVNVLNGLHLETPMKFLRMLKEWHSVLIQHKENPKAILAAALSSLGNNLAARKIYQAPLPDRFDKIRAKKTTRDAIKQINFLDLNTVCFYCKSKLDSGMSRYKIDHHT